MIREEIQKLVDTAIMDGYFKVLVDIVDMTKDDFGIFSEVVEERFLSQFGERPKTGEELKPFVHREIDDENREAKEEHECHR